MSPKTMPRATSVSGRRSDRSREEAATEEVAMRDHRSGRSGFDASDRHSGPL